MTRPVIDETPPDDRPRWKTPAMLTVVFLAVCWTVYTVEECKVEVRE